MTRKSSKTKTKPHKDSCRCNGGDGAIGHDSDCQRHRSKTKTVSLGWCGRWGDGTLGRYMPPHLTGYPAVRSRDPYFKGKKCIRVRITVEQVFDKRGRAIERVVK